MAFLYVVLDEVQLLMVVVVMLLLMGVVLHGMSRMVMVRVQLVLELVHLLLMLLVLLLLLLLTKVEVETPVHAELVLDDLIHIAVKSTVEGLDVNREVVH